jgi:hypothetical protein
MMGKNLKVLLCLLAMATYGHAYTVDGDLSDWGVTPFSDWVPNSPTADYKEENYDGTNPEPGPSPLPPGGFPYGGESYDLEALYFDDAPGTAFFGAVVSIPEAGYANGVIPGDLALDIDNDPNTGQYGFEYGIKLTGPNKGKAYYMPTWINPLPCQPSWGWCSMTQPFVMQDGSGTYTGKGTFVYVNAGVSDVGRPNYIIEGKINKAYIGLPDQGDESDIHQSMTCGNDEIDLPVDWDYTAPEFVSMAVLAFVMVSAPTLAYLLVRKKQ